MATPLPDRNSQPVHSQGWKAVVASSASRSHQKHQMRCQDFGGYRVYHQLLVGAIADGWEGARYADLGARLAVETVLSDASLFHDRSAKHRSRSGVLTRDAMISEPQTIRLFTGLLKRVITVLQLQAASNGYRVQELACTLLVFLAMPTGIAAMNVGSGFLVVRPPNADYQLLFQPQPHEPETEPLLVTSPAALQQMQICVQPQPPEFICAATASLRQVAIHPAKGHPFAPFFVPLETYLKETPDSEVERSYLWEFLHSAYLDTHIDHDKTLLLGMPHAETI